MELSVCIVNWNGGDFLPACLRSVYEGAGDLDLEVIVVDNGSTDGSAREVERLFPVAKVVDRGRNDGFAAANNVAIARSSGRYLLFLNPDTLVDPGSLERMVSFLEEEKAAGALGCRLYHPVTGSVESSARSNPDLLPLLWNLVYLDRIFPRSPLFGRYRMSHLPEGERREVDWVTGACMLARREAVEAAGGFDPGFFMYCEDIDICMRIRAKGWKIRYLPEASVGHYRGRSSARLREEGEGELSVWGAGQYARSIIRLYRKHYGGTRTLLLRAMLVGTSCFKILLWLTAGAAARGVREGASRARSYAAMIPPAFSDVAPVDRRR
ncbi:MAG TPA: glycosyltransferase family 2 protein [Candidatus Eisenbacteria bacterium]|uniref:Glycosyltransferase family 2 protein n=1 Tax=Eiseniibacteriota bacterium TaxID=2212470 RepID=A0A7V2F3H5_UNCEI|nr:glycosyltransferase family 2 protein [Candidatus Eisenbacteria bacterium]